MCYSQGHPVRLIGGRLALDFVNTADWTEDGQIAHEKLNDLADLQAWLNAVGIEARHDQQLAQLIDYRKALRDMLCTGMRQGALNEVLELGFADSAEQPERGQDLPLKALLAASAISILYDPREFGRIKMCPGEACGWLFIDETRNSRRTWCCMETCGNRAKAARHYARRKKDGRK